MSKARDLANAGTALTTVSATELGYLDGVTSAVQTQINTKIAQATAINPTIVDAKGDLIAATAADTVSRIGVGANDTVLTADSTTATGLKWATPSSGGMTLLSTTNLTGTSVTISSISQAYTNLFIVITSLTKSTVSNTLVQANGSTTLSKTAFVDIIGPMVRTFNTGAIDYNNLTTSSCLTITNYASATIKKIGFFTSYELSTMTSPGSYFYDSTTAISSIVVTGGGATMSVGQIQIYGVK